MCLKKSYFPDFWKVSLVVSVFKNVGEKSVAKNYLNQLQIFWQLYMKELLRLVIGLGLLELVWYLIYPRLLIDCGMLVFINIR